MEAGAGGGKRGRRRRQRDEPTMRGPERRGPHHLPRRPQPLFRPPHRHGRKREAGRGSTAGQSRRVTLETRAREPGAGWGAQLEGGWKTRNRSGPPPRGGAGRRGWGGALGGAGGAGAEAPERPTEA